MAEEMNEEQILDAINRNSPGYSPPEEQQPAQAETAQPTEEAPQETEVQAEQPQEEVQQAETIELDPDEPLFEQEIEENGKKVTRKFSLNELQRGNMWQRDYTRKTQDLARQRDELAKAYAKQSQEYAESYSKRLTELQQLAMKTVAAELAGVDWERLAADDPLGYPAKFERRQKLQTLLQTIQAEMQQAESQASQQKTKSKAERWQKSLEILNRDIPDFGPDVAKKLIDAGKDWGFEPQEIAEWDDHRQIKMLHALMDKKAVESKRPEVEKKVALVTKNLKPGAKTASRTKLSEDMAKLKKSGKDTDALAVFEALVR